MTPRCFHTARVEDDQAVAVAAAQHAGLLAKYLDDPLGHLALFDLPGTLVGQVRLLATAEPETQRDGCRDRTVVRQRHAPLAYSHAGPAEPKIDTPHQRAAKADMSHPDETSTGPTPAWALQRAAEELYDIKDAEVIAQRAREIVREGREREDERHNEYDDPDEGGEA